MSVDFTKYFDNLSLHSDGCARSGAFINISYALERLKVEGIVDIFNAVKSSRIRRAELVGNVVRKI